MQAHDFSAPCSIECHPRRMISLLQRLDAPSEPRAKVILQMRGPATKCVVAVRRAVPSISLVRPKVRFSARVLLASIASRPASPGRFKRIIHACRNQIKKCGRVPFLLPMRRIGGIKSAQRPVSGEHVTFEIKSTCLGCQRGKTMIPASAVHGGLKRVHPELPVGRTLGVLLELIVANNTQAVFESRISPFASLAPDAIEDAKEIVGSGATITSPV